jgi:hypothetical protein
VQGAEDGASDIPRVVVDLEKKFKRMIIFIILFNYFMSN